MPAFLAPLLLGAAPGIAKLFTGAKQGQQAKNLQQENYVPPGFNEALDLQRQAASGGMPGMGQQINRLNQGAASSVATAVRTGSNSASILGTIAGIDANRNDALSSAAVQQQQYQGGQQRQLTTMLGQLGQYQMQNKQAFDRSKSALKEASMRNLFSGLTDFASAGAYALGKTNLDDSNSTGARFANGALLDPRYTNQFKADPLNKAFSVPMRNINPYANLG